MPAPRDSSPSPELLARLEQARTLLDGESPPGLDALAEAVGLSPAYLQRRFRAHYGVSPAEFVAQRRLLRFKGALRDGAAVSAALYDAGYGSPSRIYERSDALLGMPPKRYARGGEGEAIRYALVDTALGRALIAVTAKGVCAVSLGTGDAVLEAELQREFPRADRQRVDAGADEFLAPLLDDVIARIEGRGDAAIPLDVRATAFQWRVWQALLAIPRGETRSYRALASLIDAPRSARAVARACAGNRIAVLVPCHRIVRDDGTLGGYRWGIPRKEALLHAEREPRS